MNDINGVPLRVMFIEPQVKSFALYTQQSLEIDSPHIEFGTLQLFSLSGQIFCQHNK